ncbi:hypothetical protein HanRHA438_Chr17g0826731 [Helianthus annuus]|nr:hypothetical protein HanRHA438_Chr17g0826731 [Helianthus annuus]
MKDFRPEIAVRGHNQTHKRLRGMVYVVYLILVLDYVDGYCNSELMVINPIHFFESSYLFTNFLIFQLFSG